MIADVWTIVWKDWKELFFQRGGMRRGWVNLLILVAVFGIFLPYQTGPDWVQSPLVVASWAWVPVLLVSSTIADAIAGERERHTLETLLATRMPDDAILAGKLLASVGYAWGIAMASLILGLVTVNVAHAREGLIFYKPATLVGGSLLSLLVAGLAAGVGILVSLRAETVRQAQQTLGLATMAVVWVPILAANLLPKEWLAAAMGHLTGAVAVLAVVDAVLLLAARARFRRAELIAD